MNAAQVLDAFTRIASSIQADPPGTARIWQELRPWLKSLAIDAVPKWLPRLSAGFACEVLVYKNGKAAGSCPGVAITACGVCRQPCCLTHACIDVKGDAICYQCVAEAMATSSRRREAPGGKTRAQVDDEQVAEHEKELMWARKQLGVNLKSSWDDVKKAHRKLSGQWHPDKFQAKKAKMKAEAKFKQIQRAFDLLTAEYEKRKAAA